MVYDRLGNLVISVDANDNPSFRHIEADGTLTGERQGWHAGTRYTYDAHGEKIMSIDGEGNRTRYAYDNVGHLLGTTHVGTPDRGRERDALRRDRHRPLRSEPGRRWVAQ